MSAEGVIKSDTQGHKASYFEGGIYKGDCRVLFVIAPHLSPGIQIREREREREREPPRWLSDYSLHHEWCNVPRPGMPVHTHGIHSYKILIRLSHHTWWYSYRLKQLCVPPEQKIASPTHKHISPVPAFQCHMYNCTQHYYNQYMYIYMQNHTCTCVFREVAPVNKTWVCKQIWQLNFDLTLNNHPLYTGAVFYTLSNGTWWFGHKGLK